MLLVCLCCVCAIKLNPITLYLHMQKKKKEKKNAKILISLFFAILLMTVFRSRRCTVSNIRFIHFDYTFRRGFTLANNDYEIWVCARVSCAWALWVAYVLCMCVCLCVLILFSRIVNNVWSPRLSHGTFFRLRRILYVLLGIGYACIDCQAQNCQIGST